jgi:hypothetical protein
MLSKARADVTIHVKDLDAEMDVLRKRGVRFQKYDLPGVKTVRGVAVMGEHRGAWIEDPAGNVIGLHEGA